MEQIVMEYDLEYFDEFLENPESFSDEEFLEIGGQLVEFMRTNIGKHNITEEMADDWEQQHLTFKEDYEAAQEAQRQLEIAERKVEESTAKFDEALVKAMEKNRGKPIPMFANLPKKRGGN